MSDTPSTDPAREEAGRWPNGIRISFSEAEHGVGNAMISPDDDCDGPYWTLIGGGSNEEQNRIAAFIVEAVNSRAPAPPTPAVTPSGASVEAVAVLRDLIETLQVRGKMMTVSHDALWALEKRARAVLASLTPAPTQGDGGLVDAPSIPTCGPIVPMDDWPKDPETGLNDLSLGTLLRKTREEAAPSPSPASDPSPAGGVREALDWVDRQIVVAKRVMKESALGGNGYANFAAHDAHKHLTAIRAALSSPATPEAAAASCARFDEEPRVEALERDVPVVWRRATDALEYALDIDTREIIGARIFLPTPEPALAGGADPETIARWKRDSELLSAIQDECWDVRFTSTQNADAGDYNINIEIVGHFMAKPHERVVGEDYSENLRAALEQAMTAEAYPPERPVYNDPSTLSSLSPASGGAEAVSLLRHCATCNARWNLFPPVKIDGSDHYRCVECKAVYPGFALEAGLRATPPRARRSPRDA